jgi:arylformamidase
MPIFDVSVPLSAAMPTYPGNPAFVLEPLKRISAGGTSNLSAVHLSAHAGTHVDAPRHFIDDGPGTDALPLDILIGPARVVELTPGQEITVDALAAADLGAETRLLFKTTNSSLWNRAAFEPGYVYVGEAAAHWLVTRGTRLVGVDYLSVEQFRRPGGPTHRALLGGGVVVIEGLNLSGVAAGTYELLCLPLSIIGSDGAPARVVLRRA